MARVIAFIPVRGGSKSIPYKNIKDFCGKPLIYWTVNSLNNVKQISEIVIATDSEKIRETVKKFNFSKVKLYNRDPANAQDTSSTEDVMMEYINNSKLEENDLFLMVQATSPFTLDYHFEQALNKYWNRECDSLLSCVRLKRFLWNKDGTPINYDYTNRPRRQEFNGTLMENGAFYINTVGNITKYRNRLSGKICYYEMPEFTGVEIDEEDDWYIAEKLMRKYVLTEHLSFSDLKLFIMDVDGVLTDGGMYYSENGDELKKFNTTDGKGIELLRKSGIKTAIITSENTKIIDNRAEKLNIDYIYKGIRDKLKIAKKICEVEKISLNNVAFIGDDINDINLLKKVKLKACPSDAQEEVKKVNGIKVMNKEGGRGAVREFVNHLIYIE